MKGSEGLLWKHLQDGPRTVRPVVAFGLDEKNFYTSSPILASRSELERTQRLRPKMKILIDQTHSH